MKTIPEIMNWITRQKQPMLALTRRLSQINTHTLNIAGLKQISSVITKIFLSLHPQVQQTKIPKYQIINSQGNISHHVLHPILCFQKRPHAKKQIFLVCHLDTVYLKNYPIKMTAKKLKGPGVADAKGGIVVLFKVLEALEKNSDFVSNVGWQVILNTDEEIGSPGSGAFIKKVARKANLGLVFEPCLADGKFVGQRKGSGNFTLIVRGKSAHAGRDHQRGRNAIYSLAKCIAQISDLKNFCPGLTVNFGCVEGGTASNVVPDLATARFNVRIQKKIDQNIFQKKILKVLNEIEIQDKVKILLKGNFTAEPKLFDHKTLALFNSFKECGKELGIKINWKDSGGVCDGNRLAQMGLPTIDTLGVQGGNLHSSDEYLYIPSLTQRTKLTALFLLKWARGESEI